MKDVGEVAAGSDDAGSISATSPTIGSMPARRRRSSSPGRRAAGQAVDVVVAGQRPGDGEADPSRGAGDEHAIHRSASSSAMAPAP